MCPDLLSCAKTFTVISSNPYNDPESGIMYLIFQMRQLRLRECKPLHMVFTLLLIFMSDRANNQIKA